jgi:hypothetical protein
MLNKRTANALLSLARRGALTIDAIRKVTVRPGTALADVAPAIRALDEVITAALAEYDRQNDERARARAIALGGVR